MRGKRITWRGGYTTVDGPTLQSYHTALQSQFGFVPVGTPVYRTFGANGKTASAHYEQGMLTLWCQGDIVIIEALVRANVDSEALKRLTIQTFGLTSIRRDERTDYLTTDVQELEL